MVEVNEKQKNTPWRSTTASTAAAFISTKTRMKHQESNVAIFHPPIHFLYPFVLFIVARGLSQQAPGERQDRSVIHHRAMAVLCHNI